MRTTNPMSMVRQWQLRPKDKLHWEWEVRKWDMIAIVVKYDLDKMMMWPREKNRKK